MSDESNDTENDFDFDRWATLAGENPEQFEREREALIGQLIDSAPEATQRRLLGLQWQLDNLRQRNTNPLSATLHMSNLMWEKVAGEGGLLDALDGLSNATEHEPIARPSAVILPFPGPELGEEQ